MRIAVTGVGGFIGFHCACRLLDEGHEVFGLDNLNDYYDVSLKQDRLQILLEKGLHFKKLDLCDPEMSIYLSHCQPDILVHLAAQAGVRYASINPAAYTDSNLVGFFRILEWVRENPKVPLVFASSSSVYGNASKVPFTEKDPADQPESFYAATKRANELMAYSYHQTFGITARGLRFFTVYGPWGRPDMAYFSFTQAFVENRPLKIFHGGQALRDYTYISDIIDGLHAAIFSTKPFEIYNLGHHHPHSILELVNILETYFGKKAELIFEEGPKGDVDRTFADIHRAAQDLGFSPKVPLKEGMALFLDWYSSYYAGLKISR